MRGVHGVRPEGSNLIGKTSGVGANNHGRAPPPSRHGPAFKIIHIIDHVTLTTWFMKRTQLWEQPGVVLTHWTWNCKQQDWRLDEISFQTEWLGVWNSIPIEIKNSNYGVKYFFLYLILFQDRIHFRVRNDLDVRIRIRSTGGCYT